jgi:molybdopterin synthase sulfur carrier subunit
VNKIKHSADESLNPGDHTVNILFFGQVMEITGTDHMKVVNPGDTVQLVAELTRMFAPLAQTKYVIAVDKKMITGNTSLNDNCTVAFLPPFSGG